MMHEFSVKAVCGVCLLVLAGCAPRPATRIIITTDTPSSTAPAPRSDTSTYEFSFPDTARKNAFIRDLEAFTSAQRYASRTVDGSGHIVRVDLLPAPGGDIRQAEESAAAPAPAIPVSAPQSAPVAQTADSGQIPVSGGRITWYTGRGFVDDAFISATGVQPFGAQGIDQVAAGQASGVGAILVPSGITEKKITLTLSDTLRNSDGKPVSALDLVLMWNKYVREHPAEGFALFRHVKGIEQFIRGNEGVISGITAVSSTTVTISLSQSDPDAFARLCTRRLLPASSGLGAYHTKAGSGRSIDLAPNRFSRQSRGLLDMISIITGGDRNPFLAYSMGKYDCLVITSRKDAEYAKRTLYSQSQILEFSLDRYFLSVNAPDSLLRRVICGAVNPRDILMNAVRADGEVVGAIESDSVSPVSDSSIKAPQPFPVSLLYRLDDPVSIIIAERLSADFKRAGLVCELKGKSGGDYERALTGRDYGVAVGWVPREVLHDRAERLRLASMWFGDDADERSRIALRREIALFMIRSYLLCGTRLRIPGGDVAAMYLAPVSK